MVDEKLIIETLESLKVNINQILNKPDETKYLHPDHLCQILDRIIKYINDIKT